MRKRILGKEGPEIPVLGFGAWPIGGAMGTVDKATAIATVRSAIDQGITLIDTAQSYRTSETTLGQALADGYRERCFLATKVSGRYAPEDIRKAIENSLHQLRVEYVDLYQIHGWNPKYPIADSMETMEKLQREGKTRFIGVSNFNAEQMAQARAIAPFHSNQVRYNLYDRQIETGALPFCAEAGIGILAHSPLAKGLLTGRYEAGHQFPEDDERSRFERFQGDIFASYCAVTERLQRIATAKGVTLVQMAIAWLLRLPTVTCVLVGAKNPEQVKEHATAPEIQFSDEELSEIEAIVSAAPPHS